MATLGKMSEHIDLIQPVVVKDAAGFATTSDEVIASVRAYGDPARFTGLGKPRRLHQSRPVIPDSINTRRKNNRGNANQLRTWQVRY